MPIFKPDGVDDSMRRATGDLAFDAHTGPSFESAVAANIVLEGQGITTESSVAVRTVEAGESFDSSQGDFLTVHDTRVLADGSTQAYEYTAYDVGQQIAVVGEVEATTPIPALETAINPNYNVAADIDFTSSSAQTVFGEPLLAEQRGPQETDVHYGSSFENDPASAAEGIASAVAILNTGDEEVVIS